MTEEMKKLLQAIQATGEVETASITTFDDVNYRLIYDHIVEVYVWAQEIKL